MWIFLGLVAALFFGIIHIIDSYCVEEIFEESWFGVLTSSITSLLVLFPIIPFVPIFEWSFPPSIVIISCVLSGICIQTSQWMYFKSLSYSEPGIVAAYWNMIPILICIFSYAIFGIKVGLAPFIGILILISSSTYLLLLDENINFRMHSLLLMFFACILQTITYILLDWTYMQIPYFQSFLIMTVGLICTGFIPLLFKEPRNKIRKNYTILISKSYFFLIVEALNLAALFAAQKAVDLGVPTFVAAIETTIPGFAFLLSIIAFYTYKGFTDERAMHFFPQKLATVCFMIIGIVLLS